jgi:hypothetical protein
MFVTVFAGASLACGLWFLDGLFRLGRAIFILRDAIWLSLLTEEFGCFLDIFVPGTHGLEAVKARYVLFFEFGFPGCRCRLLHGFHELLVIERFGGWIWIHSPDAGGLYWEVLEPHVELH